MSNRTGVHGVWALKVHHTEEKNVLLTLMEIVRLAAQYGLTDLPDLIRMEREIELMESNLKENGNILLQTDEKSSPIEAPDQKFAQNDKNNNVSSYSVLQRNKSNSISYSDIPLQLQISSSSQFTNSGTQETNVNDELDDTISSGSRASFSSGECYVDKQDGSSSMAGEGTSQNGTQRKAKNTNASVSVGSESNRSTTTQSQQSDDIQTKDNSSLMPPPKSLPIPLRQKKKSNINSTSSNTKSTKATTIRNLKYENGVKNTSKSTGTSKTALRDQKLNINSQNNKSRLKQPSKLEGINSSKSTHVRSRSLTNLRRDSLSSSKENLVPENTDSLKPKMNDADVFKAVHDQMSKCTCCNRISLRRIDDGRYRFGNRIYYLRRFRSHIMVRVGGGWLTLEEFFDHHDPCRRGKRSRHGSTSNTSQVTDQITLFTTSLANGTLSAATSLNKINTFH